ncbi:hypothetical protein LXA43DRAFT_950863 [Ganoderma leucocontextum]|nr:hypothetical protein LXA43DRAFT_950863 [Ganoderma leucocontextum]
MNPVQRLRSILTEMPYCSGTLDVKPSDLALYYGKGDQARHIDLSKATTVDLDKLTEACEPAPFGRNDETVFDESYRRAREMEPDEFKLAFDVERTGLMEVVRSYLLHGSEEDRFVKAELYKLNVYGKDSFFKPHKDTPRADNMFGSLVIALPTPHQGGELVLRHNDHEWTFDSGTLLSGPGATSRIAFVSFFSDVEHEVLPVKSGHRLTATYNLYFSPTRTAYSTPPSTALRILQPSGAVTSTVSSALAALLADPRILPKGGTLGFGLQHQYPLPKAWTVGDDNPLDALQGWLKGSDAALFRACTEHGLTPLLRLVYEDMDGVVTPILSTEAIQPVDCKQDDDGLTELCEARPVEVMFRRPLLPDTTEPSTEESAYIQRFGERWGWQNGEGNHLAARTVDMVTDIASFNQIKGTRVVSIGNGAETERMYMDVCLIVEVGPAGKRRNVDEIEEEPRSLRTGRD